MQNSAQWAAVNIANPVPIGHEVEIPPGPFPQNIPEQQALTVQPAHMSGPGFTMGDVFGLFNIFVGLMVVMAILLFVIGTIVWFVLLGTVRRSRGIRLMEWGVVILFVLTVVLAIIQFFVGHPAATAIASAIVIVIVIGYIVLEAIKGSGRKEPARPARPERRP